MACVHDQDQMLAYLYDLLPNEKTNSLQEDLESCPLCQDAMIRSKEKQVLLKSWEDTPVPEGLFEKTLARINRISEHSEISIDYNQSKALY